MKKVSVILLATLALVSCMQLESARPAVSDPEFKVSLTVGRTGAFDDPAGTKATIKSGWTTGDVVFVFFKDVAAPKYLELKRVSNNWVFTPKNGLTISDLGAYGMMSAIYMPYGNDIEIRGEKGNFYFSRVYNGLFYIVNRAHYIVEDNELKGSLELSAPALTGDDKYIHFDISGYDRHTYRMYQDYVKPLTISGINSFFDLKYYVGKTGEPIEGYIDDVNGIVSFSGVLDKSVVGNPVDYEFSINDFTADVLYTRDVGEKAVNESMYIGIGDISNPSRWIATEYVVLTQMDGYDFCWAKKNLGATAETGEGSYGNFYAWGDVEGYPLEGTFGNYTCSHDFSTSSGGTPADDPAHYALKGLWRMPDYLELSNLFKMFNDGQMKWVRTGKHASVSFGHTFYNVSTDASVFLPGAGVVVWNYPVDQGQYGEYWTASSNNLSLEFSSISVGYNGSDGFARTIRPVFTVKSLDDSEVSR